MRLLRTIQLVALGLWVGSGLFFSYVVAPQVFRLFTETLPGGTTKGYPEMDQRMGRRLAGATVGAVFPAYFATQAVLGVVASVATWLLWRSTGRQTLLFAECVLLAVAVTALLVQVAWVFPKSNRVLAEVHRMEVAGEFEAADRRRQTFGMLHGFSQVLNLLTLGGAAVALVLAAWGAAAAGNPPAKSNSPAPGTVATGTHGE